jgi:hypothetical protein
MICLSGKMQRAFWFLVFIFVAIILALNSLEISNLSVHENTHVGINEVQAQTNVSSSRILNTGEIVLNDSVKRLVILIPNEAHEPLKPPTKKIFPYSFAPQVAVIAPGTEVVWFNGDQGYHHPLTITETKDKSQQILIPETDFLELSRPHTFNQVGNFEYTDIDTNDLFSTPGDLTSPRGVY